MRVDQALGGTNRPGVSSGAFAMSDGMRIRYDFPVAGLVDCVTGYAIYISDRREPVINWYLPAPAMIVILLDAGPLSASIRNRSYGDVPTASLWGASGHALRTVTHGGISVGIGLTATGWARLTARSAAPFANTIGNLSEVIGVDQARALTAALEQLDDDADIASTLDMILPGLFRFDHADAEIATQLERAILQDGVIGVGQVADMLRVSVRDLRRLAVRDFGQSSKTLLSRARFVRSYARWLMLGEQQSYAGIDSSYFDASHFLRDAQTFLGTTPRRFTAQGTAYLRASLHARSAVIGAPAHALHHRPSGGAASTGR